MADKFKINNQFTNVGVTRGNLDVLLGDQISIPRNSYFSKSLSNFTLSASASVSLATTLNYTINPTAVHGLAPDDEIILLDTAANRSLSAEIVTTAATTATLDRPIDHSFASSTTLGRKISTEMAVNGSATEQIFSVRAGDIPVDHTRVTMTMLDSSTMDDGKFGGIAALGRGLVFRIVNSFQKTIFTFKSNSEMKQFGDVNYSDSAPAGQYGLDARFVFAGQQNVGVALRIESDDVLQWVVQDDLTGLDSLRISVQGHDIE
jgi:hypothetical protein